MSTAPAPAPSGLDRRLLVALLVIGGVLAIGIIVLIVILLTRGGGSTLADATTAPSTSAIASATPTPTPTSGGSQPTSAPVDNSTHFTSFTVVTTVHCDTSGNSPKPVVTLSWASKNAVEAWFSPADVDAKDQGYMQVPTTGNQNDLTDEHLFDCNHRQTEDVTITLVGPKGEHVSRHATITDANWQG
jgi:cytoskeletal protein RodZ